MADSSPYRPPFQLIDFVAWKLGVAMDSFYGRVLALVPHADTVNRSRMRRTWPWIVEAWEAWQAADGDGQDDFELPTSSMDFMRGRGLHGGG